MLTVGDRLWPSQLKETIFVRVFILRSNQNSHVIRFIAVVWLRSDNEQALVGMKRYRNVLKF